MSIVQRALRPDAPEVTYINPRFSEYANADTVPISTCGNCQAPVLVDGDHAFYAPCVAPVLGDFCVVDVLVARMNQLGASVGSDRKLMIKRLRAKADRSLWWHEASGAFPVSEHHKVMGTILLAVRYPSDPLLPWTFKQAAKLTEIYATAKEQKSA